MPALEVEDGLGCEIAGSISGGLGCGRSGFSGIGRGWCSGFRFRCDRVTDDGLIGNAGKGGDRHEFLAEAEMAEFTVRAIRGLYAGDDFQGTARSALASDAIRAVDLESAGAIRIAIEGDPDGNAIGRNMEDDWFDGDVARRSAGEFDMGLEKEISKMAEFRRPGERGRQKQACGDGQRCYSPTSHNESLVLPDGS